MLPTHIVLLQFLPTHIYDIQIVPHFTGLFQSNMRTFAEYLSPETTRPPTFQTLDQFLIGRGVVRGHQRALVGDIKHRVPDRLVLGVGEVGHEPVQLRGELVA